MISAPPAKRVCACTSAASGARYLPPSENESSVMLRMPRIFMSRKKGGLATALSNTFARTLARLRLRGNNGAGARGAARLARHRHRGAFAARGQHRVFIGRAHRGNALEQGDDLIAGQSFVFQQTARQDVQIGGMVGKD